MEEIKHVAVNVSKEEATNKAMKYLRPRNFWQSAKKISFGRAQIIKSIAAIYVLLFPITLPIFLLTKKKHNLDWVRLAFWPFYKATVQLSTSSGLKSTDVFVEGMTDGLSQGIYDPTVSGERYMYEEPHSNPFYMIHYKGKKELKNIVTSAPPENSAIIPFSLDENSVADYILDNLLQKGALGDPDAHVRGGKVIQIERVYYPIWIAKYSHAETARIMTLGAANKRAFHRMDISAPMSLNSDISALFEQ